MSEQFHRIIEGRQLNWSKAAGYANHLDPVLIPQDEVGSQPNYKEEYVRLQEVLTWLGGLLKR